MDINLTGPIAANVALSQSWYALVLNIFGGAISAAIGALAVYKTTQRSREHEDLIRSQEDARADRQIRRDLIAQLYSKKRRLVQLYFSFNESKIYSRFYEGMISIILDRKIADADYHIKENRSWSEYWIHRGNDIQDLLHAEEEGFLKIVGLISLSFPETERLITLIGKIDEIRTLIPPYAPEFKDLDSLEGWKDTALRNLDTEIRDVYLKPIDDLMDFLKPYLETDPKPVTRERASS